MLKVDKLCALRFITVIKSYDCNSSYYEREGSSFITSELGGYEWSVFSRNNSCKSYKIHDLASSGFRVQPGVHKILRKLNFLVRISYLLPTCHEKFIEELSAKSFLFFQIKIEHEALRESRSVSATAVVILKLILYSKVALLPRPLLISDESFLWPTSLPFPRCGWALN